MPELPEVETVRLQLQRGIKGKTIKQIEVYHQKSIEANRTFKKKLIGQKVAGVDRIGKLMIVRFVDEADLFLLIHLKMTGQLFVVKGKSLSGGGHLVNENDVKELPGRHTRVAFTFSDDTKLFFNDMRLFGYLRLVNRVGLEQTKTRFGPEPIVDSFDQECFYKSLNRRRTSIKAALLDQTFVAGLGNIYVDEALWRTRIKPERLTNKISRKEAGALVANARAVLLESIAIGGTTFQHFVDAEGKKGNFTDYLKVFGKQSQPCPRCGQLIKKIRLAARGTHFCPGCQK